MVIRQHEIKRIRKILDMNREQFGELLGVTGTCVGYYEKGTRYPAGERKKKLIELKKIHLTKRGAQQQMDLISKLADKKPEQNTTPQEPAPENVPEGFVSHLSFCIGYALGLAALQGKTTQAKEDLKPSILFIDRLTK